MRNDPAPDPRRLALYALDELDRREAYADALLDGLFRRHGGLDARDRALATNLVYGVLRWRHRLDRFIETAAERPLKKLDPRVLIILRLGAFQLLHLDRTPDAAAVNASVALAKGDRLAHAAGLVNAVLRRIARGEATPPTPENPAERLAFDHSIPPWLAQSWIDQEGLAGAELLARAASRIPPLYLRLDTRRRTVKDALADLADARAAGPGAYAGEAVWAEGAGDPRKLFALREADAVVQGQASQLVAPLLALKPGMRVLDACAGPGLKTSHIARLLEGRGDITALDLHPHRVRQIETLLGELGYDWVRTLAADAREYVPGDAEPFDAALVDAPCSGLGVLAHAPERKWRADPGDPLRLAGLQREILDGVARWVRPGGLLVYATCTTSRVENEDVVESFLQNHPDYAVESARGLAPEALVTARGFLRTFPADAGGDPARDLDAFFAARLRRSGP